MKKIILILLLVLVVMIFHKEAKALEESRYNLIDSNQINYDASNDVFYSTQKISLSKDQKYTLVASRHFFGTVTKTNPNALDNREIGAIFYDKENNALDLILSLTVTPTGLHYSSFTPKEDCYLEITDFLTKGYTLDTLPKREITLFSGSKEAFTGFRENEYTANFEKVSSTINIYTGYKNPITVDSITEKIKVYDNVDGFSNNITLVEDNYQNTNQVGIYTLTYKSIDKNSNEGLLTVNVNVVDGTPPVIEGPDVIKWDCYESAPVPELILQQYKAIDELDGNLTVSVVGTSLTRYQIGKVCDYEILLEAKDKSGNKTQKLVIIKASDITKPNLTLKDVEIKLSQLGETAFGNFFEQAITEIGDNSGEYTISVNAEELIDNMGFTGTYTVTYIVSDFSGNQTEQTAIIKIVDDLSPEFYMHVDLLTTTVDEVYSAKQLRKFIGDKLNKEGILYDDVNLISSDYFQNEKTPGKYQVKYMYSYKGQMNYMVATITVEQAAKTSYYWVLFILIVPVILVGYKLNKKRKTL